MFPPQAKILLLLKFRKIEIVRQDSIMHVLKSQLKKDRIRKNIRAVFHYKIV